MFMRPACFVTSWIPASPGRGRQNRAHLAGPRRTRVRMASSSTRSRLHYVTPLVESVELSRVAGRTVWLKLENTQPSGSFKIRGIGNLCQNALTRGCSRFVSSSGGNAGAAVAYAGRKLGIEVIVVVPATTPEFMRAKIEAEGAHVRVHGDVWDEADLLAKEIVDGDPHACYISPFDHPDIWEGHATMIEEVQAQLAEVGSAPPSAVALSVGGGGLLLGACVGMQRCGWDAVPILAAETEGAASLSATVAAGRIVALPSITSVAKSLGARQVSTECLRWLRTRPIVARTVTDHQAVKACQEFATHHRYLVEPACGAAIALAYLPDRLPSGSAPLVVVVCGGNIISPTILDDLVHQVG